MLRGKYRGKYSQQQLEFAVGSILEKGMSLNEASRQFGVPRGTLFDKTKGRTKISCELGHPTVLLKVEEDHLASWAIKMSKIGYGRTKQELCLQVKKVLDAENRVSPFTDNIPGRHWMDGFLQRHPTLSLRSSEALGVERAHVTVDKIEQWFEEYEGYIRDTDGGEDLLQDPSRLFNADESGFPLAGKSERVLAQKGSTNVYNLTTSDKSQITVMACCSASGFFIPPMLIFPGIRFRYNPLQGAPTGACLGRSGNGWIDSEIFFEWLANHFHPSLVKEGVQFPVVLLVDGHRSHINLDTANFCHENKIILYCLPPHASHIIQPLDVAVFGPMKKRWSKEVRHFMITNPGAHVTKQTFSSVFKKTWECAATEENAVGGFRNAGIYPLDRDRIDRSKMLPSEVFATRNTPGVSSTPATPVEPAVSHVPSAPTPPTEVTPPATAVNSALAALEAVMNPPLLEKYRKRLLEGYDLPADNDQLFSCWKKLKVAPPSSDPPATSDIGATPTATTTSALSTPGTSSTHRTPSTLGSTAAPGTSSTRRAPSIIGSADAPGTSSARRTPSSLGSAAAASSSSTCMTPSTHGPAAAAGTSSTRRTQSTLSSAAAPGTSSTRRTPSTLGSAAATGTSSTRPTPSTLGSAAAPGTSFTCPTPPTLGSAAASSTRPTPSTLGSAAAPGTSSTRRPSFTPNSSATPSTSAASRSGSSLGNIFAGHLRYPSVPISTKPRTRENLLPKAISGDKYRQYLAEKKKKEEEAAKERRKVERANKASDKKSKEEKRRSLEQNVCSICKEKYNKVPEAVA